MQFGIRGGACAGLALVLVAGGLSGCDDEAPAGAPADATQTDRGIDQDAAGGEGGAGGAGGEGGAGGAGGAGGVGGVGGVGGEGGAGGGPDMRAADLGLEDRGVARDAEPLDDLAVPDMDLADVGPLDGARCDPRLRAQACEPGQFCVRVPGGRVSEGRCQTGDGCRLGIPDDCPDPARPACHLRGGSTICAPVGALAAGAACVDALGIPQPCAAGLVCNNSVCQQPCTPGGPADQCPNLGRCADISAAIGVPGQGLCGPRGCDWFSGDGCEAGEDCSYAIQAGTTPVGSCFPEQGQNLTGSPCAFGPAGGHNCAQGLHCLGAPNQDRFCFQLCDFAMYEAPCPNGQTCLEGLALVGNDLVRGYGICRINP